MLPGKTCPGKIEVSRCLTLSPLAQATSLAASVAKVYRYMVQRSMSDSIYHSGLSLSYRYLDLVHIFFCSCT